MNGQFETIMQTDGNLVTYDQSQGTPVWSTGTLGNPGAYVILSSTGSTGVIGFGSVQVLSAAGGELWSAGGPIGVESEQLTLQSDGNLQLLATYQGNSTVLWQSGTPSAAYSLLLEPGQAITSPNGLFQLVMQTDGNLVEYLIAQGDPLWSTATQGNPGAVAVMQDDGNLVVYSAGGSPLWASGTTAPNPTLALQNDGNLVIYGSNSAGQYPVWSSHTNNARGYELTTGQLLQPGQYLESQNRQYVLKMSGGGNVSISSLGQYVCPMWSVPAMTTSSSQAFPPQSGAYLQLTSSGDLALWRPGQSSGASMWDTGTSGGETAVMQNDGNLVVYSATGTALWSSGTSSTRGSYLCAGSTLSAGQQLEAWNDADTNNVFLQSSSTFSMQTDCNLVLYNSGTVVWASNTDENQADPQGYASGIYDGCYVVMQSQGNLVVYAPNDGNKVLWASGTQQTTTPEAVPPVVGPVFLVPVVGTTKQSSECVALPNFPCPTVLSGTPDIYSSAGPLLGNPLPATSGGIAQWVVSALNTLVFFFGAAAGPVGTIATVLGGVDTGISDIASSAEDSGGTSGQASAAPGSSTGSPVPNDVPAPITACTAGSPDQLASGGQLAPGGCLRSANGQYALVMQTDGNLVLYDQSQGDPIWATGTTGNSGAYLRLQANDGNLVESNQAGTAALWSTGTSGTPNPALILGDDGNLVLYANGTGGGTPTAVWSSDTAAIPPITTCAAGTAPSVLRSNQVLASGGCLRSANGQYELVMQTDGNLVLYYTVTSDVLWATGTVGNPGAYLRLQSTDGNLVLSNQTGTTALWSTGIIAPRPNLTLQNDGNLVLTANNEQFGSSAVPYAAWATGTQSFRGSTLPPGQVLQAGQYLQNGQYRLTMGATGLLVLTQTTAASTVCPMWTVPTADAAASGLAYNYTGLYPENWVSTPPTPGAYLTMQTQGNLVLYPTQGGATALWATPTSDSPGAALTLSGNGIVAVTAADGTVLWQALPANDEGLMLCAGGSLAQGQYITGDQPGNADYQLVMQSDCNLVFYNASGGAFWSSDTDVNQAGQGKNNLSKSAAAAGDYNGCYVQMQTDGNLVMYAPNAPNGSAMWASNSEQSTAFSLGRNIGPYYLTLESGGFATIFNLLGNQLWNADAFTSSNGTVGVAGQKTAQTIFEILELVAAFV